MYYPAFDYLRFILALTVVAFHADVFSWEHAGNFPVQIFFALSGWLIGGVLLETDRASVPRFYFNRAARIWIPYFSTVLLLILAYTIFTRDISAKWIDSVLYKLTFVWNFFGINHYASEVQWNGNHLWSICAEEQFYLIAPLLIVFLPIGRSVWFWICLSVIFLATPASDFFGAVSLGVTAAVIQRDHFPDWHLRPWSIAILVLSALLLFISTYLGFIPYLLGSALSAIFIVLATAQPGRKASTVAEFMGGMSYPLYLHHWIGLWLATVLVRRLNIDNLSFQVSAIVLSVLIAAALYLIIDRTVRARRNFYFTPARGRALAITGYVLVTIGTVIGLTHTLR